MKVTLEKDYRKYYTIEDVERAKAIIEYERKEDEETAAGWLKYAAREVIGTYSYGYVEDVLTATARTAKNYRAMNAYNQTSGDMDIWIEGVAKVRMSEGKAAYIEVGAYLSDIWQTGCIEYKQHTSSKIFVEQ